MTSSLPSLSSIISSLPSSSPDSPLATALSTLFEPSPTLHATLVPQLATQLTLPTPTPDTPSYELRTYSELVDAAIALIDGWDDELKKEFVAGHPRIGESKGLSSLSAKEQGAAKVQATPPEVLERLSHLNKCYEHVYPGLRYITFVNGRSRAAIAEELENVLGLQHGGVEQGVETLKVERVGSGKWKAELGRAVEDVGKIAKSRLAGLGVE